MEEYIKENYEYLIKLQQDYENGEITVDKISIKDLKALIYLCRYQINKLQNEEEIN